MSQEEFPLTPPICPALPFLDSQESMEPPTQPPPWKKPSFGLPRAQAPQLSPQRMLMPRVSWSGIVSHSQESLEDEPGMLHSPRTPAIRLRRIHTPPPRSVFHKQRPLSDDEESDKNEGRFDREFCGVEAIGKGQFSTVYRAQNRIDKCVYAVKKTTQIARKKQRQAQLREVFALANISMEAEGCPNIVRYFSSWVEDGRLHIQTELCECSLRDRLMQRRREAPADPRYQEPEVVEVIRDVANGLSVLHSCGFVHLDIKPDNLLVSRNPREKGRLKIADLGLAAAAMGTGCDITEGDCRYLAKEVLRGDLSNLPKADVLALGLVCYELTINPKPLPPNGEEWQSLRRGRLEVSLMSPLSSHLIELLSSMVHPLAAERPACQDIKNHHSVAIAQGDALEVVKALEEEVSKSRAEAARNKRLADQYWQEMMQMKRQELLTPQPSGGAAWAVSCGQAAAAELPSPPPALRRGRTVS